jgi:tRNA threonylcarbamoyladenosine biosynthesis protein TsaE
MPQKIILKSEEDTRLLAQEIAAECQIGDVLALIGPLGAGKTFFTQKLCEFLGVEEIVSSPSYILLHEYSGRIPIAHLDLYRLVSFEETLELGLEEIMDGRLTIIEWAELVLPLLPEKTKKIRFELIGSDRIVNIE